MVIMRGKEKRLHYARINNRDGYAMIQKRKYF